MKLIGPACFLLHAGFLFGLLFGTEDGKGIFLHSFGWLSRELKALHPRRQQSSKFLNLRGKYQVRVYEKRVLRRIFGYKEGRSEKSLKKIA
jgi:hypothetical protein